MSVIKEDIEALKPILIGRRLTNLFHTELIERFEMLPGVNYVNYFRTILEIDNKEYYDLWKSYLNKWDSKEQLFLVTSGHWDVPDAGFFIGQRIKDIIVDNNRQIYVLLENDYAIQHIIEYGDVLRINLFSKLIEAEKDTIQLVVVIFLKYLESFDSKSL